MTVPSKVWEQMMYLCKQVPSKEWSGIIFSRTEGSPEDLENFHVIAEDIFLKDIGTATYTEYTNGEEEIDFLMDNDHLLSCDWGKIHSHNTMNVFHSGTDVEDLWNNTATHNYYLSFIVNNRGDVEVKIAWRCEGTTQTYSKNVCSYSIKDANGKVIERSIPEEKDDRKVENMMIVADGVITIEKESHVDDWFESRFDTVYAEHNTRPTYTSWQSGNQWESNRSVYKKGDKWVNGKWVSEEEEEEHHYPGQVIRTGGTQLSTSFAPKRTVKPETFKDFLVDFISLDTTQSLALAVSRIDDMKAEQYDEWLSKVNDEAWWLKMFNRHFDETLMPLDDVKEGCATLLSPYRLTNPDMYRELTVLIDSKGQDEIV